MVTNNHRYSAGELKKKYQDASGIEFLKILKQLVLFKLSTNLRQQRKVLTNVNKVNYYL